MKNKYINPNWFFKKDEKLISTLICTDKGQTVKPVDGHVVERHIDPASGNEVYLVSFEIRNNIGAKR